MTASGSGMDVPELDVRTGCLFFRGCGEELRAQLEFYLFRLVLRQGEELKERWLSYFGDLAWENF